jgi:uncharacterized membrane protein YeaQ/YmgE (transglycosylase-associated protein family)
VLSFLKLGGFSLHCAGGWGLDGHGGIVGGWRFGGGWMLGLLNVQIGLGLLGRVIYSFIGSVILLQILRTIRRG